MCSPLIHHYPSRPLVVQFPALRQIVAKEGMVAIWSGVQARVCFHFPASAICWGTYETVKALFFTPSQ